MYGEPKDFQVGIYSRESQIRIPSGLGTLIEDRASCGAISSLFVLGKVVELPEIFGANLKCLLRTILRTMTNANTFKTSYFITRYLVPFVKH